MFIWRAYPSALAINSKRLIRNLCSRNSCPRCKAAKESPEQALLYFPKSKSSWQKAQSYDFIPKNKAQPFLDIMNLLMASVNTSTLEIMVFLMWVIWISRNDFGCNNLRENIKKQSVGPQNFIRSLSNQARLR